MPTKYYRIRKEIIDLLKSKGQWEKVDRQIIEEISYNFELIDQAKEDLRTTGLKINIRNEGEAPYYQPNPSINTYYTSVKLISALFSKLGITVLERNKLKSAAPEEDDGF